MSPLLRSRADAIGRRRYDRRPMLETLEGRIVMAAPALVAAARPAAQVRRVRALAEPALDVALQLTKLDITSVTRAANGGALELAGTANGSVLGLNFATPIVGRVVPGRGGAPPTLTLDLAAIDTTLLGLNVKTGVISFDLTGRRAPGRLDDLLRETLNGLLRPNTTPGTAPLNALLADSGVLGALNLGLDRSTPNVGSFTAGSTLGLSLDATQIRSAGLGVGLENDRGGAISLDLTTAGAGQLGGLVGGLTGTSRTVTRQLSGVLGQITALASSLGGIITTPPPSTTPPPPTAEGARTILDLNLNPIDLDLLGVRIQTSAIRVTVSARPGSGALLGNLLNTVGGILNLEGVNNALNNVLANVVTLVNAGGLAIDGVGDTGPLGTPNGAATTVQVVDVQIAPVNLDLLGVIVQTSPIRLTITANTGQGQVLGNVVAGLANLLNPLGPDGRLDVPFLTAQIRDLNGQLDAALPGIPANVPGPTGTTFPAGREILEVRVPPLDIDLLGLLLTTDTIEVNATAQTGDGKLLGNLLNGLLNSLSATPEQIDGLNAEVNRLLARVVGVLNEARLTLPPNILGTLSQALQTLALPTLVSATPNATTRVLDLVIATPDSAPPVLVDLLGLVVTTSDIRARLDARTGDGQILGNLVYNVSHLLDPGGAPGLLALLNSLGI